MKQPFCKRKKAWVLRWLHGDIDHAPRLAGPLLYRSRRDALRHTEGTTAIPVLVTIEPVRKKREGAKRRPQQTTSK